MRVRKLIIQYPPDGTKPSEEGMKKIRQQFEKEDIILLDGEVNITQVEYDEIAFMRK